MERHSFVVAGELGPVPSVRDFDLRRDSAGSCFRGRSFGFRSERLGTAKRPIYGRLGRLCFYRLNAREEGVGAEAPTFSVPESTVPSGEPSPLAASHPGPAS
jgi:hypothetical protein